MELTIQFNWGNWIVVPKEMSMSTDWFWITCETSEEAMEILQQLNGKSYEVIHGFAEARKRLTA
jgi:hypothetical protein